jgi:hypothetical protein
MRRRRPPRWLAAPGPERQKSVQLSFDVGSRATRPIKYSAPSDQKGRRHRAPVTQAHHCMTSAEAGPLGNRLRPQIIGVTVTDG